MKHNWETKNIGSIFNFEKGMLQSSKNTAGDFVFITASENFKTHIDYSYDTEALCFAFAASGSLGRTHYFNGKFTASDLVYVLTPKDDFKDRIDLRFHFYFLNHFKDEIVRMTKSGTSKASINREAFSTVQVPLPPLKVQQKILSTLEEVNRKTDEIKQLRIEQIKDINNLLFSKYTDLIESAEWLPMKNVAPIHRRQVEVNPEETYYEIGVRSFGRGLFENPSFKGADLTWQKPFWMREGDLLFSNIKAWEGAVGLIPAKYDGWVGSHRYITCLPNLDIIHPEFLYYYFRTFEGVEKLSSASPGTVDRNRTLNNKLLMQIEIPVPSLELQREFVELLEKTNAIKEHHKQTEQDLTELMPSLLDKAFKGELFSNEIAESFSIAAEPKVSYVPNSSIPENKKGFAKQVLGGKIVSLFKDDKQFTNIKLQKLQYLAEHIIEEDLNWNYYRQSAGPYDNKFMHSVFYKLQQNQWFENRNYKFSPLKKADDIDRYYQNYFGNKEEKLNKLFSLLQNASEKFCEAVATIYAVWNNHIIQNLAFDKSRIKTDFFEWSNRKEQQFTEVEFEKALDWMNKQNIVPTGFGQLIKEKK